MGHSSDDRSSAVEAVLIAPVSDDVLALAASAGIGRGSSSGRSWWASAAGAMGIVAGVVQRSSSSAPLAERAGVLELRVLRFGAMIRRGWLGTG